MRSTIFAFIFFLLTASVDVFGQSILTAVPNPFSISTELTIYDLMDDTVSLKIFTPQGQVVADFFDNLVISGTLSVTFVADTLPIGVYLVVLNKNGENHGISIVKIEATTDLQDVENQQTGISIFPNPTFDFLTISTDFKINKLSLFSAVGKQVLTSKNASRQLDIQSLRSGIYYVHLQTDGRTYIKKVVKR